MGQIQVQEAIAPPQPTLPEFLHLCSETDITKNDWAQTWGIALLKDSDFNGRWRLVKVFSRLGDGAIAPLLEIAEDDQQDVELRWFAIRILGQYKNPEAIARLILLLDDCREEFLAEEILQALTELQEQATDYVVPLLRAQNTRLLAVKALCRIRYPNTVEPLLGVVNDSNPTIRLLAIEALGSFRHPLIFDVLLKALADPVGKVRLEAVRALGYWAKSGDPVLIFEQVTPLLKDFSLEVCRQAAFTLSRLQTAAAAEAIATVLTQATTPLPLQKELMQALGWIDDPSSLHLLGQFLPTAPQDLLLEALKAIGRISEPQRQAQATAILLEYWQTRCIYANAVLRQTFAYVLGQLQQPAALPLLTELSHDLDDGVKLHAIAALKKMSSSPEE